MLPAHETLPARCFHLTGQYYLATGNNAGNLTALGENAFAPACIRYAFPYLGTHRPFFVTLAADDRGKLYRGLDAIDWIAGEGLLYPRSDAAGLWPDGTEGQLFLKELDLAVPLFAFASPSESDFPGARLTAAIELVESAPFVLAPGGNFPARLLSAIPALQLNAAVPFSKTLPLIPLAAATPSVISLDSINNLLSSANP
jgi:hypothetical protein